jgi:uncharacterized Fe-S center protein
MSAELLFARYKPKNLEPKNAIGAKWQRLLDRLDLGSVVAGQRTAIKMHLGGGAGFSTIHPFLVRQLVAKVKAAGAKEVFVTDGPGDVRAAADRGYTTETLGCAIVSGTGTADRYVYSKPIDPPLRHVDHVGLAGEVVDADALIDLSHVKGHGACGFGGASKNLSMGAVDEPTRGRLHQLEGGLTWDGEKCDQCRACIDNCPTGALSMSDAGEWSAFLHHCRFCQHCVLICPQQAIAMDGGAYADFQRGMALTTTEILKTFAPGRTLFINMLLEITIYCDCWGMTLPRLVPDIGILAGRDIVAIEHASLDLIRTEDLIPGTLPDKIELGEGRHLFEKIHGKDPFRVIDDLEQLGQGGQAYTLREID